jgi:predicted metal-dependent enzyme (double-stranded beta helix superfamily)
MLGPRLVPGAAMTAALDELAAVLHRVRMAPRARGRRATPAQIAAIESWLRGAVGREDFLLECLEHDMARLTEVTPTGELPSLHEHPRSGVRLALGYWSPGSASGAHEHRDWTVSSVLHNQLEVTTYDLDLARRERRLAPKHVFTALRGHVGAIVDRAIHQPRNPTRAWSISLHIQGAQRSPGLETEVGPVVGLTSGGDGPASTPDLEPAVAAVLHASQHQGVHRARLAALSSLSQGARTAPVLEAIWKDGDDLTRRRVAVAWLAFDEPRGRRALEDLAHLELHAGSELEHAWPAEAALGLRVRDGQAEVTVGRAAPRPLLRVPRAAETALRFITERSRFELGEVPGGFELETLRELTGKLLLWGALHVVPPRARGAATEARP